MQIIASLVTLIVLLAFLVSLAARRLSGTLRKVAVAAWIVLITLLAVVVFAVAASVSDRAEVAIGATIIFCGVIIAWKRVARSGRIKVLVATALGAAALVFYTIWINLPRPIPQDRIDFVGVWTAASGFRVEIRPDGRGTIRQRREAQDWEHVGIKVAPNFIDTANVEFEGRQMTFIRHGVYARVYTIDKAPFTEGGRQKMILNGIELVRE